MERSNSPSFDNNLKNFNIATRRYLHFHDESSINAVLCSLQVCFKKIVLLKINY